MIHSSFPSMGTTIEVVAEDETGLAATRELFASLEQGFSRFLDDSELSLINRSTIRELPVSDDMARILRTAQDLRHRTQGLVDPAVGASVLAWGYDRTFVEIEGRSSIPAHQETGGWEIDDRTLVRDAGVRLDLGGIAKGWAADEAVDREFAAVVSAGGDVRSSMSSARVEVVDPWGATPATVPLGRGALATSSVTRRRWRVGGEEAHHLIDPRTGDPAVSPVLSATAMCATAAESEAAAKAVLLNGVDGLAWADAQPWITAALVVWNEGSVFATNGWEVAA